jgi:glycine/D-amino acid oxidase-like deaminating enzyme
MSYIPSYWGDTVEITGRWRGLEKGFTCDFAIIGAGYTGLWTALYLAEKLPGATIAVLEARQPGFGASGRNGGWLSTLFPVPWDKVSDNYGKESALSLAGALSEAKERVVDLTVSAGIDCDLSQAGALTFARNRAQLKRLLEEVRTDVELGFPVELVGPGGYPIEASKAMLASHRLDCCSLNPAKLVTGLAEHVSRTVLMYGDTVVEEIEPGRVVAAGHEIRAKWVIRATESFTVNDRRRHRVVTPLFSNMIVTEPLSDEEYEAIGSPALGLCFADSRNMVIYGQVTRDRRIAFGGRGAPYSYGSFIDSYKESGPRTTAMLADTLADLFPILKGKRISRAWGGTIAISRDWYPRIVVEPGLVEAFGYAGDGVTMANLVGHTIASRLAGEDRKDFETIFERPIRYWEREPLRWAGITAMLAMTKLVDALEDRGIPAEPIDAVRKVVVRSFGNE